MRVISLVGLLLAAMTATSCGGNAKTASDRSARSGPAVAKASATRADAERVVHGWIDDDNCSLMSDRLAAEGYGSAAEGRAACSKDTDPGLQAGQYTLTSVTVQGQRATARLALTEGGTRTINLVRGGRSGWEIDATDDEFKGHIGDTFTLRDSYEQDGVPVTVDLRITPLSVTDPARPPRFFAAGNRQRWVRIRLKLHSRSASHFNQSTDGFKLVDNHSQRYTADGAAFQPSLGNGGVDLSRGDTVEGYLGFKVPRTATMKVLRTAPTFSGGAPLEWLLHR